MQEKIFTSPTVSTPFVDQHKYHS